MRIYLIRHGKTPGNQLNRYIGITDEPVLEEDQEQLKKQNYPKAERLFVSPLLRCRQTAACIYPGQEQQVIQNLRECDFGRFENKNWKEMTGDAEYQAWVDSNATLPFPGGEDPQEFRDRACQGFLEGLKLCAEDGTESAAFVVHGGIIMAVLERFADRKKAFYEWHVGNGEGYEAEADPAAWSDASGQQPVLRVTSHDHRYSVTAFFNISGLQRVVDFFTLVTKGSCRQQLVAHKALQRHPQPGAESIRQMQDQPWDKRRSRHDSHHQQSSGDPFSCFCFRKYLPQDLL